MFKSCFCNRDRDRAIDFGTEMSCPYLPEKKRQNKRDGNPVRLCLTSTKITFNITPEETEVQRVTLYTAVNGCSLQITF